MQNQLQFPWCSSDADKRTSALAPEVQPHHPGRKPLRLFMLWKEVLILFWLTSSEKLKFSQIKNRKTVRFLLNDPQSNKSKNFCTTPYSNLTFAKKKKCIEMRSAS